MRKGVLAFVISLTLASCTSHVSLPSPTPGVLAGVVMAYSSQHPDRAPLAGVTVVVYHQAVSVGGPVQVNPPSPVATTTTDSAGSFRFEGLGNGRWFVIALGQAGGGQWVSYDPATGTEITLVVCTDCPVPL